jgi:hypothetical protein
MTQIATGLHTSVYYVLNKNINATCKVYVKLSICTKSLFLKNVGHKFACISVSEHFFFAKIIHPPDRCGISRIWWNSMIITQVHLVLGIMKGHSQISTQHNATDVSSFEGAGNWNADCRECPPELLPENWTLAYGREMISNVVLDNLAVCPTSLTTADHV